MKNYVPHTDQWLKTLGYSDSAGVVYRSNKEVHSDHPYAREIHALLGKEGEIHSTAIYEIDRVPAVCFIEPTSGQIADPGFIDEVRRKIWNQNLISIVIVVQGDHATAFPAAKIPKAATPLSLSTATADGLFSASDINLGGIHARLPDWFEKKNRVDRVLLDNLSEVVRLLCSMSFSTEQAQLLLGKCIFVSYLEDRGIIGNRYRERHQISPLLDLLSESNAAGLDKLFRQLKKDFNGDLLEIEGGANVDWRKLSADTFELLSHFLLQTRMSDGQRSLWKYDFKYIPVELISGIYESFLNDQQRQEGAVYTPRNLATLAVDEAFAGIERPWEEIVLDGACGSGILLTSAYRRMLGAMKAAKNSELTYVERQTILLRGIRGGDISASACKVTVFSLYLVLLEDLAPTDIVALQEDQNVKLPPLIGFSITKPDRGDFFATDNTFAKPGSASIIISNPPWFEPTDKDSDREYETWWREKYNERLPRRQIALAFARKATDILTPGGRLCLILPAAILGAADAGDYLLSWFRELSPERIYNLSDIRRILFDGAVHPTAVISGIKRFVEGIGKIPPSEVFDYFVPKVDFSLAFGRLTVHSFDRKKLSTYAVCNDSEILRTYFWGSELDESLIARLRLAGTIQFYARGDNARFVVCKGFHKTDNTKAPISSRPLTKYPFLNTAIGKSDYPKNSLFVTKAALSSFPNTIDVVADYGSKRGQAFEGVRVLFTDGADSNTLEVRAAFTDQPCCFTQSVAAIVDREGDADLMQFMAAYLRSKLARYLLFYTTFSLTMERPHIKLAEIENLPFSLPEEHDNVVQAKGIVSQVARLLKPFRSKHDLSLLTDWPDVRDQIDELIFDYFGLSLTERVVVNDTCNYFIPSSQPVKLTALKQPLFKLPNDAEFQSYREILKLELENWRDRFQGDGHFSIQVIRPTKQLVGATAIVKIDIYTEPVDDNENSDLLPTAINQLLTELQGTDQYPLVSNEAMSLTSDFLIRFNDSFYLVKPMVKRLWIASAAAQDAFRIVQTVRNPN